MINIFRRQSAGLQSAAAFLGGFRALIPAWLRGYRRADLAGDGLAGLVTAILLVPQGMAFALLAGLPPQVGLYASILPPLIYAWLGTSRTLAVGPVSVAAIMVATALSQHATPETALANALALALLSGAVLLLMGWLRLGVLVSLLAHPVLAGFTSAAAILIIASQLPQLSGLSLGSFTGLSDPWQLSVQPAVLGLGVVSVAALLLMGAPLTWALSNAGLNPQHARTIGRGGPLVVVFLAAGLSSVPMLQPLIPVVGSIPAGLPVLDANSLLGAAWAELLPSAVFIALIGYVESIAIAKSLAQSRGESLDANRELLALGSANLGAAFSGGMPVAGGFSRTLVNVNAGARTQLAGLITALLVGLAALTLTDALQYVPKAALAAIIIVAVAKLIDLEALKSAWRYDRLDAAVIAVTFAGVLALGIEQGLLTGMGASLVLYVWRSREPHIAVLGRVPGSEQFRNVVRHRVETQEDVLLVRVDENLNFANSEFLEARLLELAQSRPALRHLVLIGSGINYIDISALTTLEKLISGLNQSGVTLHMAEIKGPVIDRLERSDLLNRLAPGRIFSSPHEALSELVYPSTATSSHANSPAQVQTAKAA